MRGKHRFGEWPQEASFIVFTGVWARRATRLGRDCEIMEHRTMGNMCAISGGPDTANGFDNRLEYGVFERVILGAGSE